MNYSTSRFPSCNLLGDTDGYGDPQRTPRNREHDVKRVTRGPRLWITLDPRTH
jgi:hypothetical protein